MSKTRTLVPDLERKIALKENEISYLTGDYPSKIERAAKPESISLPETLPVGLPSTLLERRPDVRKAEQNLIAANAEVGVALTNMFPRIALTATYGTETSIFNTILKSPYELISANLLTPLFGAGQNIANHKAKKAALKGAVAEYEESRLGMERRSLLCVKSSGLGMFGCLPAGVVERISVDEGFSSTDEVSIAGNCV